MKKILALSITLCLLLMACGTRNINTNDIPTSKHSKKPESNEVVTEAGEVKIKEISTVDSTITTKPNIQPATPSKTDKPVIVKTRQQYDMKSSKHIAGLTSNQNSLSYTSADSYRLPNEPTITANYKQFDDNAIKQVAQQSVSTFSLDVDTASYANVRRFLNNGSLPAGNAIRTEELINYFSYNYSLPEDRQQPFSVHTEMAGSPWSDDKYLLHIGIKAYEVPAVDMLPVSLTFLIDVSGSMRSANKLDLLKKSLKLLNRQLDQQDNIAIVVYAGAAGVVLKPTKGNQHYQIEQALEKLTAGGSTNGGAGIRQAYAMAQQMFNPKGINRVILATDGDFNVGITNHEALKDLIKQRRENGITLTVLGFGGNNYNDHLMEELSNIGNGNAAFIDSLNEAKKVLVNEMSSTMQMIAKDVKVQIEFNPDTVAEYRLIGYENRLLKREDFNNDKVDAGDIGAGHSVTAIYEISLSDSSNLSINPLRYQNQEKEKTDSYDQELAFVRLRYKRPDETKSHLVEHIISKQLIQQQITDTSESFRFAAAVAGFGQLLRGGKYCQDFTYQDIHKLANPARGKDPYGYRAEFIQLVDMARILHKNVKPGIDEQNSHTEVSISP